MGDYSCIMNDKRNQLILILSKLEKYWSLAKTMKIFVESKYASEMAMNQIITHISSVFSIWHKWHKEKIKNKQKATTKKADDQQMKDIQDAELLLKELWGEAMEQENRVDEKDIKIEKKDYNLISLSSVTKELGTDLRKRQEFGKELESDYGSVKLVHGLLKMAHDDVIKKYNYEQIQNPQQFFKPEQMWEIEQDKALLLMFWNLFPDWSSDVKSWEVGSTVYFHIDKDVYNTKQSELFMNEIMNLFDGLDKDKIKEIVENLKLLWIDIVNKNILHRKLILKNIQNLEDIKKITTNTLSEYLVLNAVPEEYKKFVAINLREFLVYYLSIFPWYRSILVDSDKMMTWNSVEGMNKRMKNDLHLKEEIESLKLNKNEVISGSKWIKTKAEFRKWKSQFDQVNWESKERYYKIIWWWDAQSAIINSFIDITDSPSKRTKDECDFCNGVLRDYAIENIQKLPKLKIWIYEVYDLNSQLFKSSESFYKRFSIQAYLQIKWQYDQAMYFKSLHVQNNIAHSENPNQWTIETFMKKNDELKKQLAVDQKNIAARKESYQNNKELQSLDVWWSDNPAIWRRFVSWKIESYEREQQRAVWNYISKLNEAYVQLLLNANPQPEFIINKRKIQSPLALLESMKWMDLTLDFSEKKPEDIVRDGFMEHLGDSFEAIYNDIMNGRFESAFSNILGMVWGIWWAAFTRNSFGFAAGQRLGRGIWWWLWALTEGRFSEMWDAFGAGLWLVEYDYDEKNTIIDGVKYVDIKPTKTGARWSFMAWADNEKLGIKKGEFDRRAGVKVWLDFGFDMVSVYGAWKISKIVWLDKMLTPMRNAISTRYGTAMANSVNALKRWLDEMVVESFLVDLPLNVIQTGLYTFSGIDDKIRKWSLTNGTEKTTVGEKKRNARNIADAFSAMWEAREENTSAKNIADQIANTMVYGLYGRVNANMNT